MDSSLAKSRIIVLARNGEQVKQQVTVFKRNFLMDSISENTIKSAEYFDEILVLLSDETLAIKAIF